MKFPSLHTHRQILGMALIVIAVALLIYDFFSPPMGQLSNFALILFAKLIAIAGSLLNIPIGSASGTSPGAPTGPSKDPLSGQNNHRPLPTTEENI